MATSFSLLSLLEDTAIMKVTRTERGWIGHYCCAHECLFRRNTLLEAPGIRIVVSSVGLRRPQLYPDGHDEEFCKIGIGRYYETLAFHARLAQHRYWDADIRRQIRVDSDCCIGEVDADDKANDMHEAVVAEITAKLEQDEFVFPLADPNPDNEPF